MIWVPCEPPLECRPAGAGRSVGYTSQAAPALSLLCSAWVPGDLPPGVAVGHMLAFLTDRQRPGKSSALPGCAAAVAVRPAAARDSLRPKAFIHEPLERLLEAGHQTLQALQLCLRRTHLRLYVGG